LFKLFLFVFSIFFSHEFDNGEFSKSKVFDFTYKSVTEPILNEDGGFSKEELCRFLSKVSELDDSYIEFKNLHSKDIQVCDVHGKASIAYFKLKAENSYFVKIYSILEENKSDVFVYHEFLDRYLIDIEKICGFPNLVREKYIFQLKDSIDAYIVGIYPFVKALTYNEIIISYKSKQISQKKLENAFYLLGKAFAQFHNYFMDEDYHTITHPDPHEHNYMLDDDNQIYFIDYYGPGFLSRDQSIEECFFSVLKNLAKSYGGGKNKRLRKVIYKAYCEGYYNTVYRSSMERIKDKIESFQKRNDFDMSFDTEYKVGF